MKAAPYITTRPCLQQSERQVSGHREQYNQAFAEVAIIRSPYAHNAVDNTFCDSESGCRTFRINGKTEPCKTRAAHRMFAIISTIIQVLPMIMKQPSLGSSPKGLTRSQFQEYGDATMGLCGREEVHRPQQFGMPRTILDSCNIFQYDFKRQVNFDKILFYYYYYY